MNIFQIVPLLLFAWITLAAMPLRAGEKADDEEKFDRREHYTKYEYRIPMRDGVRLFTAVYVPKDAAKTWPFLIVRTPYSVEPYGVDHFPEHLGPSEEFEKAGYIFVKQDIRGRFQSGDEFVEMRPHRDNKGPTEADDASDLYDTIDWLLKNVPDNNGKAGVWGISYPGFYTAAGIIDSHPALKAASPQAPIADLYMGDDTYHHGALMLAANFDFYASYFSPQKTPVLPPKVEPGFDYATHDSYQFYLHAGNVASLSSFFAGKTFLWDDQWKHDTYDEYWQARNIIPHLKNIHCAVLNVGGWFDAEDLAGPFNVYQSIEKNNPGIANTLVVGPWVHGGWADLDGRQLGHVDFAAKTAEFYRQEILFPFFEQYLRDGADAKLPEAFVFETGTNLWRKYPHWPPQNAVPKTLYFQENGLLTFDPPAGAAEGDCDEYVSDPAKPVPFVNYTALDVPQEYMVSDQRFASTRTDVLTWQTPVLEDDVTVAGPVSPRLFVSTSGTDSDFVVKLIDVYPADPPADAGKSDHEEEHDIQPPDFTLAGYQQLVRGEPFRGKFRHSFSKPEPFVPGQIESLDFAMPDINHTFRRGHRIMVQVQSSWFPLTDRNPQTFCHIPTAEPKDFVPATERVYRDPSHPSGISLPILPAQKP